MSGLGGRGYWRKKGHRPSCTCADCAADRRARLRRKAEEDQRARSLLSEAGVLPDPPDASALRARAEEDAQAAREDRDRTLARQEQHRKKTASGARRRSQRQAGKSRKGERDRRAVRGARTLKEWRRSRRRKVLVIYPIGAIVVVTAIAALLYSIGFIRFTTDDGSLASLGVQFVTPTPGPTEEPSPPTPTQVPGRSDLYKTVKTPEHMAYIWWEWSLAERKRGFEQIELPFTIHNEPQEMPGRTGLYLMLCSGEINSVGFYFGLQTNVHSPEPPHDRGKGLLFSRWEERDLANARSVEQDGWTQSSGHEGDFIGVRRSYDWGPGSYVVRIGPDGRDQQGNWIGLWITDLGTDETTWIGSLRFPRVTGETRIEGSCYSTLEVYGGPIRPIDIGELHVSMSRPVGDGVPVRKGTAGYRAFGVDIRNADIRYDSVADLVHIRVGGLTKHKTETWGLDFD